jgi:hypothetical protein
MLGAVSLKRIIETKQYTVIYLYTSKMQAFVF